MTQSPVSDPETLVSTEWLAEHLNDPDLCLLDASWYMPNSGRDPKAEFEAAHIPGARFFDLDGISDETSSLPHMAPPVEKFISRVRALGMGDGMQVVIYDGAGIFSAPRVWWTFRLMGFTRVAVLDGGLPKWQAEGRPVSDAMTPLRERHLMARATAPIVRSADEVNAARQDPNVQIIDARPAPRFRGEVAEPRPGLKSGHIPGSLNLPFGALLEDGITLKSPEALRAAFEGAGLDLARPVITSCGSGVTAAILALGLERVGHRDHVLYDGSWAEWGMRESDDIETGPSRFEAL